MSLRLQQIADLLGFQGVLPAADRVIHQLLYDSRRILQASEALFVALEGKRDGHLYLEDAWKAGVRVFLVRNDRKLSSLPDSIYLRVPDTLKALQQIAAFKRQQSGARFIGITGSNGKTVVKEWLYHLLHPQFRIGRSPKSFNSQLGVPLSVWQIPAQCQLALIEAGISEPGEMGRLEEIIRPEIGILTGIGSAHDEGFASRKDKIREKLRLFDQAALLVYPADQEELSEEIKQWSDNKNIRLSGWSLLDPTAPIYVKAIAQGQHTVLSYGNYSLEIPFSDKASIENACTCLTLINALLPNEQLESLDWSHLPAMDMRLQLKKGIAGSVLINDAYSLDLTSLEVAMDFLKKQAGNKKQVLVLSEPVEQKLDTSFIQSLNELSRRNGIALTIGVGDAWNRVESLVETPLLLYPGTRELAEETQPEWLRDSTVLIKGARAFAFEKLVHAWEEQVHETVLEIDLDALEHNFRFFKSRLKPETKMMAMVKAQGYGSGSREIAYQLQSSGVDYLAVAYTDEGVALRRQGISLPIMVMNPGRENLAEMLEYGLEPDIYDFDILQELLQNMEQKGIPEAAIHLEFDTGMHRLGFERKDLVALKNTLQNHPELRVKSIFAHLAAADGPQHDAYTEKQIQDFELLAEELFEHQQEKPLRHILNTPGILRFPQAQLDMVRLGIGLYGISPISERLPLQVVGSLKASISQIRELQAGETVGYSRKGVLNQAARIAVISIGYADGFRRSLSNGKGHVWINGHLVPVVGNVCMDMTMVDVSQVDCRVGDVVELFGKNRSIEDLAAECDTIPYEIISSISERVRRVYWRES